MIDKRIHIDFLDDLRLFTQGKKWAVWIDVSDKTIGNFSWFSEELVGFGKFTEIHSEGEIYQFWTYVYYDEEYRCLKTAEDMHKQKLFILDKEPTTEIMREIYDNNKEMLEKLREELKNGK